MFCVRGLRKALCWQSPSYHTLVEGQLPQCVSADEVDLLEDENDADEKSGLLSEGSMTEVESDFEDEKESVLELRVPVVQLKLMEIRRKPVAIILPQTFDIGRKPCLDDMPVEILLGILSHGPAYMSVSFGGVCKRFREVVANHRRPLTVWDLEAEQSAAIKAEVRQLYHCKACLDVQSTKCILTDPLQPQLAEQKPFYCSGCRKQHSSLFFSDAELVKEDNVRKCIGWKGHLQLDAKTAVTFQDVCRIATFSESATQTWTGPWRRYDHSFTTSTNGNCTEIVNVSISSGMTADILIQGGECKIQSLTLSRYGGLWRRSLDRETIFSVLESGAIESCRQLCPHLKFSNSKFRHKLTIAATCSSNGQSSDEQRLLDTAYHASLVSTGSKGKTSCSQCLAYLYMSKDASNDEGHSWTFYKMQTRLKNIVPSSHDWLMHMETGSYDFSVEAKHLLWCGVASCHTNRALANRWFEDKSPC